MFLAIICWTVPFWHCSQHAISFCFSQLRNQHHFLLQIALRNKTNRLKQYKLSNSTSPLSHPRSWKKLHKRNIVYTSLHEVDLTTSPRWPTSPPTLDRSSPLPNSTRTANRSFKRSRVSSVQAGSSQAFYQLSLNLRFFFPEIRHPPV